MSRLLKSLSVGIHPALEITHLTFHLLRHSVNWKNEVEDKAVKKVDRQSDENVFHAAKVQKSVIDNRKSEVGPRISDFFIISFRLPITYFRFLKEFPYFCIGIESNGRERSRSLLYFL